LKSLDTEFVRSQFPACGNDDLAGASFFENAGGSYMPYQVINRLGRFHSQRRVQPYWPFKSSTLAGNEMDESRIRMSELLNIPPETLHFGSSTSQNTYVLATAFRDLKTDRRVIIVTNQDHEANSGVWRRLDHFGYQIKEWKVQEETGQLLVDDLKELLDENVCLLTFPHCSNIIGEINPVKEICSLAKKFGVLTCVDGVSFVPHSFPDISALGADIYLFSAYKTYGPHLGLMYVNTDLNSRLPSQGHFFNDHDSTKTLTPAGPDHAQIASIAGIVDYVELIDRHHFGENSNGNLGQAARRFGKLQRDMETALLTGLMDFLNDKEGVHVLGDPNIDMNQKVPTISIHVGNRGEEIVQKLASKGLMAGSGDFYSVRLLKALKIKLPAGVLRLSFVHYTKSGDVSSMIQALDEIL
tara:strand:- start:417 stop:1655 length:1239 start_codon:yes stop_codon:yes gene_type:complete